MGAVAELRVPQLGLQTILSGVVVVAAQVHYLRLAALPNMLATAAQAAQPALRAPNPQVVEAAQLPATLVPVLLDRLS
jgi:hypothetical protein